MIKSSLGKTIPNITELLQELGLDQSLRAENLSPQDYIRIAKAI